MESQPRLTERMKQCKSRTGMLVPCIVYKAQGLFGLFRDGVLGKGFILYNSRTGQVEVNLFDDNGDSIPIQIVQLEQQHDKEMLVVYSESVN